MKRIVTIIAVAMIVTGAGLWADDVFAPQSSDRLNSNIISYVQLDIMASEKSFMSTEGNAAMRDFSQGLDPYYKNILYKEHSRDITAAITLNMLTGGLGSWSMGDHLSGALLEIAMASSYTFSLLALTNTNSPNAKSFSTCALVSSGIVAAGGILMPIVFGSSWNSKLNHALSR